MSVIPMTIQKTPLRSFFVATLMLSSALTLSACIGAFEEHPARYNSVTGGKRSPVLNPKGDTTAPKSAQQQVQPSMSTPANMPSSYATSMPYEDDSMMPPAPMTNYPTGLPSSPNVSGYAMDGSEDVGPSPLYYYEQQQNAVTSQPLPQQATANNPEPAANAPVEALEPSPLAQFESSTHAIAPSREPSDASYPDLADVPASSDVMNDRYHQTRNDADLFIEEQGNVPNNVATSQRQPIASPDVPPSQEYIPIHTPPQDTILSEGNVEDLLSPPQETAMPHHMHPDNTHNYQHDSSVGEAIEVEPTYSQANVMQQPLQPDSVHMTNPAPMFAPAQAPMAEQQATPYPQTYDPGANTVSVAPAPGVSSVPESESLYTGNNGSFRLIPPEPIGRRANTLPQSRYSKLRNRPTR